MVTAGVYILIRSSPLLEFNSILPVLILWLGGITAIVSSLIGFFQQDIKKVIAYSTMSQLAREYKLYSGIKLYAKKLSNIL
jgi:NADH-ubiquinone oxidoreductase chain 5